MHRITFIVRFAEGQDPAAWAPLLTEVESVTTMPDGSHALELMSRVEHMPDAVLNAARWLSRAARIDRWVGITVGAAAEPPRAAEPADLVGVAELAKLLGVTQARARVLTEGPSAPRPVAVLRSGPVWMASDWDGFDTGH